MSITDDDIKNILAPKLQAIMAAGYRIEYGYPYGGSSSWVIEANTENGVKIRHTNDVFGDTETWLSAERLGYFPRGPQTIEDLSSEFHVTLGIKSMLKLLPNDK